MEVWLWLTLAITLGALLTVFQGRWKKGFVHPTSKVVSWPPGPTKLPFIGNLYQLNKGGQLLHVRLAELARKHGKLMTVWFEMGPVIVVSGHEPAWEVLVTNASDFSSRVHQERTKYSSADWRTITTSNLGPYWDKLRRGFHSTALNPNTISDQSRLQEQDVSDMLYNLHQEASSNIGEVKVMPHLRRLTIQLICRLCFGPQFRDELFVCAIDEVVEDAISLSGRPLVDVFAMIFQYFPGYDTFPVEETSELLKRRIDKLFRPYVAGHKSSFMQNNANCYLDFLLSQDLADEVVIFNLFEIFMFGVDSSSTTIAWALGYLIHNQETQNKLYEEVHKETGTSAVTVKRVSKLQYLNAVVKETMRMKPVAPLAVPHTAARDSHVMGFKIMAGTPIFVNLFAMHHDPDIWVEPLRFMPERFLAASGTGGEDCKAGNVERSFLPFGAGRRICAGMELAKLQVSFVLASLVKEFQWSGVADGELPDLSEEFRLVTYNEDATGCTHCASFSVKVVCKKILFLAISCRVCLFFTSE